jgi:hypothetical protein
MIAAFARTLVGLLDAVSTNPAPVKLTGRDAALLVDRYGFKVAAQLLLAVK